jgi:hypothetical protein
LPKGLHKCRTENNISAKVFFIVVSIDHRSAGRQTVISSAKSLFLFNSIQLGGIYSSKVSAWAALVYLAINENGA